MMAPIGGSWGAAVLQHRACGEAAGLGGAQAARRPQRFANVGVPQYRLSTRGPLPIHKRRVDIERT